MITINKQIIIVMEACHSCGIFADCTEHGCPEDEIMDGGSIVKHEDASIEFVPETQEFKRRRLYDEAEEAG